MTPSLVVWTVLVSSRSGREQEGVKCVAIFSSVDIWAHHMRCPLRGEVPGRTAGSMLMPLPCNGGVQRGIQEITLVRKRMCETANGSTITEVLAFFTGTAEASYAGVSNSQVLMVLTQFDVSLLTVDKWRDLFTLVAAEESTGHITGERSVSELKEAAG